MITWFGCRWLTCPGHRVLGLMLVRSKNCSILIKLPNLSSTDSTIKKEPATCEKGLQHMLQPCYSMLGQLSCGRHMSIPWCSALGSMQDCCLHFLSLHALRSLTSPPLLPCWDAHERAMGRLANCTDLPQSTILPADARPSPPGLTDKGRACISASCRPGT